MPPSIDQTALLDFIVDRARLGIFVVDRERRIVLWNQFMAINSQCPAASVVGQNLFAAFPELPQKWLDRKIESVFVLKNYSFTSWEQRPWLFRFDHNRPVTGGIDCMRQDCTLMPVKDAAGNVVSVCFTLFDATDTSIYQSRLQVAMAELEQVSNLDGLTNLYNRRYIDSMLPQEFTRSLRYKHPLAVILADIDHFKKINDTHGHRAGDEVIREIASRLRNGLREIDVIGRYGGEEFIMILPETDAPGARSVAERLRQGIADTPVSSGALSLPVTISLGITEISQHTPRYTDMIEEADKALYFSKAAGRNLASVYLRTP